MNAFSAFAALETPLDVKPRFVVEPKDRDASSEVDRQFAFRKLLRFAGPTIISWSVPNSAKRGLKAQRQAKREGLVAGVHDEHYAWSNGFAVLEWKNGTEMPSPQQVDWGNSMVDRGFRVACVRSPEFALRLFIEWGAPVRQVRG